MGVKSKAAGGVFDFVKKRFTKLGRAERDAAALGKSLERANRIAKAFDEHPKVAAAVKRVGERSRFERQVADGKAEVLVNRGSGWEPTWAKAPSSPTPGDMVLASRSKAAHERAAVLKKRLDDKTAEISKLRGEPTGGTRGKTETHELGRRDAERIADDIEGTGFRNGANKVTSWALDKVIYPWKHWGEHKIRNSLAAATEAAAPVVLGSYAVNAYSTAKRDTANDGTAKRLTAALSNEWGRVTTDAAVTKATSDTSYLRQYLYNVRDTMDRQYQIDKDRRKAEEPARAAIDLVRGSDAWNRAIREGVDSSLATVGLEDMDKYEDLYYQKFPDEESQILGERFWGRGE